MMTLSTSHDNKNEMVNDFEDVVELGKEMEQISVQNAEALETENEEKEVNEKDSTQ
ncbi:SAS053 family DNA gyrase inhibitor [Macrococcus sp. EM39E]|uniref:SAS053 family DNA gyrase inhibitor n=1 Tax=Macrococcus animalis TaxID=3395467 RepID=UPI0039BE4C2D